MRYVALLRGVNVGGYSKLSMSDLRDLLLSLELTDVTTYLQSGNAVFTSPRNDSTEIAREIEQKIANGLGVKTRVLLRTPDELDAVIGGNPFPEAVASPRTLHVVFLSEQPDDARLREIDAQQFSPDEFRAGNRVIYLKLPAGAGNSKLGNAFWERRLGQIATARNWNTVTKLLSLTSS